MNETEVLRVLRRVLDPEVGLNIVELGLVYAVRIQEGRLEVDLTMTTMACPMHGMIRDTARSALRAEWPQLDEVEINLVWEPAWTPERMSDDARAKLGW
jgi:metal-sulfur cluster biosynthetic enzyme